MRSKNLSLAFIVLLAGQVGQGIYAQQAFELTPAPSELTVPQEAVTLQQQPKPKKNPKKSTFYTGNIKITSCNDKEAAGIDLATGKTVVIIPRFKGVVVGSIFHFNRNRILQNDHEIVIVPETGKEEYGPYMTSSNTTKVLGDAAGAAVQTAGTMLNLLNSLKR